MCLCLTDVRRIALKSAICAAEAPLKDRFLKYVTSAKEGVYDPGVLI